MITVEERIIEYNKKAEKLMKEMSELLSLLREEAKKTYFIDKKLKRIGNEH